MTCDMHTKLTSAWAMETSKDAVKNVYNHCMATGKTELSPSTFHARFITVC